MTTSPSTLVPVPVEKARRKRVLDDKACEVCNDKSTGKHYGVYVCDGCSGFFKRSVRRSIPWVCRNNGNCIVDKASRTDCRACRFNKCLMVNMNPEGVQTPRGSRVSQDRKNTASDSDSNHSFSVNPSPSSEGTTSALHGGMELPGYEKDDPDTKTKFSSSEVSPVFSKSPPLSMAVSTVGCVQQNRSDSSVMVKIESERRNTPAGEDDSNDIEEDSENENDQSRRRPSNIEQVVVMQPGNIRPPGRPSSQHAQLVPFRGRRPERYDQTMATQMRPIILTDPSFPTYSSSTTRFPSTSPVSRFPPAHPHVRHPSSSTVAVSYPSSESLYSMAVRLLSNGVKFAKNIPSFKLLPFRDQVILLEESWKDLFILDAAYWSFPLEVSYIMSPLEAKKETNAGLIASFRALQELVSRVQGLEMDEAECVYLKTIVIFKADIKGLKDSQQVEKLQDDTQVKLSEYVKAKSTDNPARFGRLLLSLLAFERVSQEVIEKLFFQSQDEKISVEYILHDMFKST